MAAGLRSRVRKKRKRRLARPPADEGSYVCPTCGETVVVPLDPSQGDEQSYVEDCPVCCHPNVVSVRYDSGAEGAVVWAEAE